VVVDDTIRQVAYPAPVVEVPAACAIAPSYALTAPLRDANTVETVVARWFVNYDTRNSSTVSPEQGEEIPGPPDTADDPTLRQTSTFTFFPYDYPSVAGTGGVTGATVGALHVVELVVSNSFDPAYDTNQATLPYRKPTQNFEVQVYRWVFLTVPPSADAPCP
jgi:hypothetical protein